MFFIFADCYEKWESGEAVDSYGNDIADISILNLEIAAELMLFNCFTFVADIILYSLFQSCKKCVKHAFRKCILKGVS